MRKVSCFYIRISCSYQALTFLFRCQLRNVRLTRWNLLLQEFNLMVKYISGTTNVIDALSQNPIGRDNNSNNQIIPPCVFLTESNKAYHKSFESFESIFHTQRDDPSLLKIIKALSDPSMILTPLLNINVFSKVFFFIENISIMINNLYVYHSMVLRN